MDADFSRVHIHFEDIVVRIISDEHKAFAVETDAVTDATRW